MEHVFCICGGLNQECDKCAGTGYLTEDSSRPVVSYKIKPASPPPSHTIELIKERLIKRVALLPSKTANKFLIKINAISIDSKFIAQTLRTLVRQVDDILTSKAAAIAKTKTKAPQKSTAAGKAKNQSATKTGKPNKQPQVMPQLQNQLKAQIKESSQTDFAFALKQALKQGAANKMNGTK